MFGFGFIVGIVVCVLAGGAVVYLVGKVKGLW